MEREAVVEYDEALLARRIMDTDGYTVGVDGETGDLTAVPEGSEMVTPR